jgi:FAD-dependent oxidoreductase domain-containing protein 1
VPIKYQSCVNAAGPWASKIARLANIGKSRIDDPNSINALCVSLPVEARKRYVYLFYSENGPILNLPFVHDSSGVYFRRHDLLSNYYICGLNPTCEQDEPTNLDLNLIDLNYFENKIKPILIERVPAFKNLKIINAWSGLYDLNTLDGNLIIGKHPVYNNFIFANGSSGHGLQHAAAIGRAITELVCYGSYNTINLKRFGFERVMNDFALNDIY